MLSFRFNTSFCRSNLQQFSYFSLLHRQALLAAKEILYGVKCSIKSEQYQAIQPYIMNYEMLLANRLETNKNFCNIASKSVQTRIFSQISNEFSLYLQDYGIENCHLFIDDMIDAGLYYL